MNNFTEFQNFIFVGLFFIAAIFITWTLSLSIRGFEYRQQIKRLKARLAYAGLEKDKLKVDFDKLKADHSKLQADLDLAKSTLDEEEKLSEFLGGLHAKLLLKWWNLREEIKKLKSEIAELSVRPTKRNEKGQFVKSSESAPDRGPIAERDWTTASKEELLAEAKRRYPVKTKFICINTSTEAIIQFGIFKVPDDYNGGLIWINEFNSDGKLAETNSRYHCVFYRGKWAEIITE